MGRRYLISNEKLMELIRLKQAGESWLGIEKKASVPRRVVKRAYQDWERHRSKEELLAARREVAAAEFSRHLNTLTGLAQLLVHSLGVPKSLSEQRDAESVLNDAWKADLNSLLNSHSGRDFRDDAQKQREGVRHGRILLKALQDHTQGKVRWEALDEWKEAWNSYVQKLIKLRAEAAKILENILNQKTELKERISKGFIGSSKDNAFPIMTDGILWKVWRGVPFSNSQGHFVWTKKIHKGRYQVIFDDQNYTYRLTFGDKSLNEEVAWVCDWAVRNLFKRPIVQQVAEELGRMHTKSRELEEMLDPLILRPIMIGTSCDLCHI
jgi:hypothetical protein